MRSSKFFVTVAGATLIATAALAAHVDFNDPRRALGREDNVRIDAELLQDTISSNSPLSITYQVENLTKAPIAIADKISDVSFDRDTLTVTFAIGAEVPSGATMPHLVVIQPGQKRTLSTGGTVHIATPHDRTPWTVVPRQVQIKVNVMTDISAFAALIEQQEHSAVAPPLPNEMFDKWVNAVDAVFLNAIPIHWGGTVPGPAEADASQRTRAGGGF